jgi:hypothetical protein
MMAFPKSPSIILLNFFMFIRVGGEIIEHNGVSILNHTSFDTYNIDFD